MGITSRTRPVIGDRSRPTARLGLVVSVLAAATVCVIALQPAPASATVPTITGPDRVFTLKNVPLAFTGNEILANNKPKTISINATNGPLCDTSQMPPVYTGCASMKLDVNNGLLKITLDPGMSTNGDPNGSATLQFAGTVAQINAALQTLIFTPTNDYVNDKNSTDGTPPAILAVNAIDGTTGDSTISPGQTDYIEIRVDTVNSFPTETTPASPINVVASSDTTLVNQFLVADSDVNRDSNTGKMLLIMWVDCGQFSTFQGSFALGQDIKDIMVNQAGVDPTVADAIYLVLPDEVKNLTLATDTDHETAFAGYGTLADLNYVLSNLTFHAPAGAASCTLTQIVDDLGFRGLPAQYQNLTHTPNNYPTGVELPFMGFAIPQVTFVVDGGTVPSLTVEQAAGQADPTGTSPIHFTATFSDDVSGFGDVVGDVTLSGTAGATTAAVTQPDVNNDKVYDISVSGMTQPGTVIASVPAAAAQTVVAPNNDNTASTSSDNVVTYKTNPTVTIDQAGGQSDPTSTSPISFAVVFSEPVNGFTSSDVTLNAGTTNANGVAVVGADGSASYTVDITGMTATGDVSITIGAAAATAVAGPNLASAAATIIDNTVHYDLPVAPTPTATIDRGAGQTDPTSTSPISFTVEFSETVNGFTSSDVALNAGTTGASGVAVVGANGSSSYTVNITGMSATGDVSITVGAGAATSVATSAPSAAATVIDNMVHYNQPVITPPTVTINQGAGQTDPTSTSPITFDVVFNEGVTGFINTDVTLAGTAGATTVAVTPLTTSTYTVTVSGMATSGTVIATIPANAAQSIANPGQFSGASTSTDNTVTYNQPVITPPTVTINQGSGQTDPTSTSPITFDVVFNEGVTGFINTDVTLAGTAGATTVAVTPLTTSTYTVTVSGMATSGTVIATIPANAAQSIANPGQFSGASTSTDNTVTYNQPVVTPPTVTINQGSGQTDPTSTSPITFDVVFNEGVTGFINTDVTLAGTAGATTVAVTPLTTSTYTVTVSGMATSGTVIATIPANAAQSIANPGQFSGASTSTDNTVTYNQPVITPPTVTINQGSGQTDPTSTSPITFDVVFNEGVTGFINTDVTLAGTAGATTVAVTPLTTSTYTVTVSGMATSGTVIATIPANAAQSIANPGQFSGASTSTDNTVTYNVAQTPLTITVPPDITVPNDLGMAGANVTFNPAPSTSGGIPPVTLSCTQASGSFFPLGPTVVTCTATDSAGTFGTAAVRAPGFPSFATASASFTVTVVDTQAPTVFHPDVTVHTTDATGIIVDYGAATASDNSGVAPTITFNIANNTKFAVGTTMVTVTAKDAANNTATALFNVNVIFDGDGSGTPTPSTTVPNTPPTVVGELPATGSSSGQPLLFAALILLLGAGVLLVRRRARHI